MRTEGEAIWLARPKPAGRVREHAGRTRGWQWRGELAPPVHIHTVSINVFSVRLNSTTPSTNTSAVTPTDSRL